MIRNVFAFLALIAALTVGAFADTASSPAGTSLRPTTPNVQGVQGCTTCIPFPIVPPSPAVAITPVPIPTSSSAYVTLCSGPCNVSVVSVSWSGGQTTTTQCVVQLYNSATPTLGSDLIVENMFPLSAVGGTYAIPIPPTLRGAFTTALSLAVVTAFRGSTNCNVVAGALEAGGWK